MSRRAHVHGEASRSSNCVSSVECVSLTVSTSDDAGEVQVCDKQYKSVAEIEEHYSSYDHHHRKRLKEMKQMELERTRESRGRKEQKQLRKEQERMERQCVTPWRPTC